MDFVVYVLESASSGRLYIGHTSDLSQRLKEHKSRYVMSTKGRGPWRVLGRKEFSSRSEAMKEENRLKALKRLARVRLEVDRW